MAKSKSKSVIAGRWLIESMTKWEREFIDEEVRGYFEFDSKDSGSFQFGCVEGQMDYRLGERDGKPAVEFSWDGHDEMEATLGRIEIQGDHRDRIIQELEGLGYRVKRAGG